LLIRCVELLMIYLGVISQRIISFAVDCKLDLLVGVRHAVPLRQLLTSQKQRIFHHTSSVLFPPPRHVIRL
jgi:hypothetical protein